MGLLWVIMELALQFAYNSYGEIFTIIFTGKLINFVKKIMRGVSTRGSIKYCKGIVSNRKVHQIIIIIGLCL